MGKNHMINADFWIDDYVSALKPNEKLFYIYLMTNPHCNIAGIYQLPVKNMAVETDLSQDYILKTLLKFEMDKKVLYREGWIAIKNRIKHQKPNENMKKGMKTIFEESPFFIKEFINNIPVSESLSKPIISTYNTNTIQLNKSLSSIDFENFKILWNDSGWRTKINKLTQSRKDKIKIRLADPDFKWDEILKASDEAGDFLKTGKWFTFDWPLENDKNWIKLTEGNYKDKTKQEVKQIDTGLRFVKFSNGEYHILNNNNDDFVYPFEAFEYTRTAQEKTDKRKYNVENL